jgi:hypothetical protein
MSSWHPPLQLKGPQMQLPQRKFYLNSLRDKLFQLLCWFRRLPERGNILRRGRTAAGNGFHAAVSLQWQKTAHEPKKTKAELYEMLAEAVRNAQAENKRLQQAKRVKAA